MRTSEIVEINAGSQAAYAPQAPINPLAAELRSHQLPRNLRHVPSLKPRDGQLVRVDDGSRRSGRLGADVLGEGEPRRLGGGQPPVEVRPHRQDTGEIAWSFDTVESADLWGNSEVNSGGGAWYPPAIDGARGRIYWAAANPAPFAGTPRLPTLRDAERAHIIRVLEAASWNKVETARILDISRGTLYRKIEEFGLEPTADAKRKPVARNNKESS